MIKKIERKKGGIHIDQLMYIVLTVLVLGSVIAFYYRADLISLVKTFLPEFENFEEDEKVVESEVGIVGEKVCDDFASAFIEEDWIYLCRNDFCSGWINPMFKLEEESLFYVEGSSGKKILVGKLENEKIVIDKDFLDFDSWVYQSQRFAKRRPFVLERFAMIHGAIFDSSKYFCKTEEDKDLEEELINQNSWPEEEDISVLTLTKDNLKKDSLKRPWFLGFLEDKVVYSLDFSDFFKSTSFVSGFYLELEEDYVSIQMVSTTNREGAKDFDFGRVYPDGSIWFEESSIQDRVHISSWEDVKWIKREFSDSIDGLPKEITESYESLPSNSGKKSNFVYETNLRIDYNMLKGFLKNEK